MRFVRIARDEEIESGLAEAIAADGPVLVDVNVDYSESPPYVKGAGRQMFRNLPFRLQAGVALRLGKRHLFPPKQV